MPFKPPNKKPGHWLGFKEVNIVKVIDKLIDNEKLKAFDVALDVELAIKDSEYTHKLQIFGTFDYEDDGSNYIKNCTLLKTINNFTNAIGFNGGVNIKGQWVDENDKIIDDISGYLNDKYVNYQANKEVYKYFTYLYSERSKKDGKVYTRIWKKILPNTPEGRQEMIEYVNFCKNKGYLKEDVNNQQGNANHINAGKPAGYVGMED